MSIMSIMNTGLSALAANQAALKATSTNVANVNTTGYARLDVQFTSRQATGGLSGVQVDVTRIANAFLAAAEMRGASDVSAADILSQFMDRAQGLLGDPSGSGTVFSTLDPVFTSFGALAVDPASALRRSESLSDLNTLLSQIDSTQGELSALRDEANSRVVSVMEEANSLMAGIAQLNASIQRATVAGSQSAEAQTEQQRMLDRLSEILDIRTQNRPLGGVEVRTSDGLLLVDLDSAQLGLSSTTTGNQSYQSIVMMPPRTTNEVPLESHLKGGELRGLLRARDKDIVDLQLAFGEFAGGVANAINAAHNQGTAVPAPESLTGVNSGLIATDMLNFSGQTDIAVVDGDGVIIRNFHIDFDTREITDDSANVTTFANSIGDFAVALDAAMGADGSASFSGGVLSVSVDVPGNGVAVADDPNTPARRGGMGFSQAFGLNNLVTKGLPLNQSTGLSGGDLHGFTAGQTVSFALRDANGAILRTVDFTVGAGTTISTLRTDIDTALAGYAATSLDANGRLSITPNNALVSRVDVLDDTTSRGDTGLSLSEIFGVGEALGVTRARNMAIRSDITSDPNQIATAIADISGQPAGYRALTPGDGRAALALEAAGSASRSFATAGSLTSQVTSVIDYAARLAGHAGGRAEALEAAKSAAESVREEVKQRRMGEEGVNIDEELVNMGTYQQAYAAASRLIQAARDLYDILLQMV